MDLTNAPAPPPAPRPWSRRRRLTLAFTAVALVAGGGAAIAAGQPDTAPADAATTTAKPVPGKAAFGLGGVLHSESVVSDGNGGYVTHLTQVGTIESLDSDRLTVASADGYQRSWNRTSDTETGGAGWSVSKNDDGGFTVKKDTGEFAVGDTVLVAGTLADDVATARRIVSRPDTGEIPGSVLKRFEGEFGGKAGGKFGGKAGAPMRKDQVRERFEFPADGTGGLTAVPEEKADAAPAAEPSSITSSGFASLT